MSETRFERNRRESLAWFNKASDLMAAAATIQFAISEGHSENIVQAAGLGRGFDLSIATRCVSPMLCGMALELAYKAVIVEGGSEPPTNHDLVELATVAGIKSVKENESLLKIWSALVIWDGKYPVPKQEKQMAEYGRLIDETLWERVEKSNFKRMNHRLGWDGFKKCWDEAAERYHSLYERLYTL